MSEEETIYKVGNVVATPKGEGKIVYKDVNPAIYESIKTLDSIGNWLYMVEHKVYSLIGMVPISIIILILYHQGEYLVEVDGEFSVDYCTTEKKI